MKEFARRALPLPLPPSLSLITIDIRIISRSLLAFVNNFNATVYDRNLSRYQLNRILRKISYNGFDGAILKIVKENSIIEMNFFFKLSLVRLYRIDGKSI